MIHVTMSIVVVVLSKKEGQCSFISCRVNSDKNIESKEEIKLFPKKFSMTIFFVLDTPR